MFYLDDLASAAEHAHLAAQRLSLERRRDARLEGPFPRARAGEHGARRCALDDVRGQVHDRITTAWWALVTDLVPTAAGAYSRAAEMVLRAVMTGGPVPSARDLETTLASVPFSPPPLPDLDELLPQPSRNHETALRHHHAELAEAYGVARIPGDQMWRVRQPEPVLPGHEHRDPPEVEPDGSSLRWSAHDDVPRVVIGWGVVMDRAARHKAAIDDAAAGETGMWLEE